MSHVLYLFEARRQFDRSTKTFGGSDLPSSAPALDAPKQNNIPSSCDQGANVAVGVAVAVAVAVAVGVAVGVGDGFPGSSPRL